MDKTEYKILYDQMMSLVGEHAFAEAMDICRQIDWRKVKNVTTLCTVSEIYKINKQYEDARDILVLALERVPTRRKTLYSLCELCVKLNDIVEAIKYYNEYKKMAPNDPEQHILHYKICDAQGVGLEEKIEMLQRYKSEAGYRDDKWAYELAYLYHRCGLATKCIEECDEIMLWFGEGKYVLQAMDLKKKYVSLTEEQQAAYDRMTAPVEEEVYFTEDENGEAYGDEYAEEYPEGEYSEQYEAAENGEYAPVPDADGIIPTVDEDAIQVKQVNVDKYSTLNIQAELAQSVQEFFQGMGETGKVGVQIEDSDVIAQEPAAYEPEPEYGEEPEAEPAKVDMASTSETQIFAKNKVEEPLAEPAAEVQPEDEDADMKIAEPSRKFRKENTMNKMLSQGSDGQINLVVPEQEQPEKQITGQMDISGYLNAWEEERKERQKQRIAQARRKSLEQTNDILSALDRKLPNVATTIPTVEEIAKTVVLKEEQAEIPAVNAAEMPAAIQESDMFSAESEPTSLPFGEKQEYDQSEDVTQEVIDQYPVQEELPLEEESYDAKFDTSQIPVDEYATGTWPVEELPEEPLEEYPPEEYPSEEYPSEEYPPEEYPSEEYPSEEYPSEEYPSEEYPSEEYPTEEYPSEEYPSEEYPSEEYPPEEYPSEGSLDAELDEYFGNLLQMKGMSDKINECLSLVSMVPTAGNLLITGSEKSARLKAAMGVVKFVQAHDFEFVGKPAKVPAEVLNGKDVRKAMAAMNNAALIIEDAGKLNINTIETMAKVINHSNVHILIILEDTNSEIKKLMGLRSYMSKLFDVKLELPSYSNDDLVAHAKEYAKENEYSIDEMGVLALYTRINNLQRSNHVVTIEEVEEIMNEAMENANKKSFAHFKDVLFSRRYDDDDLIILREKDFL